MLYFRLFFSTLSELVFFLLLSSKLSFIFAICCELAARRFLPIFSSYPFSFFSISSLPTLADSSLFHNSSSFSLFPIPKTRFKLSFTFYTFRLRLLSFLFSSAIFKDKLRSKKNIFTMVDYTFSSYTFTRCEVS